MGQSIQEWTKQNLWKTFSEIICKQKNCGEGVSSVTDIVYLFSWILQWLGFCLVFFKKRMHCFQFLYDCLRFCFFSRRFESRLIWNNLFLNREKLVIPTFLGNKVSLCGGTFLFRWANIDFWSALEWNIRSDRQRRINCLQTISSKCPLSIPPKKNVRKTRGS